MFTINKTLQTYIHVSVDDIIQNLDAFTHHDLVNMKNAINNRIDNHEQIEAKTLLDEQKIEILKELFELPLVKLQDIKDRFIR